MIREITDKEMLEYTSGVGGQSVGQSVANLVFAFIHLDIECPNMFDLFMLMCIKDKQDEVNL